MSAIRLLYLVGICVACTPADKPGGQLPPDAAAPALAAATAKPTLTRADTLRFTNEEFVRKALGEALHYKRVIRNRAAFKLSYTLEASEENPAVLDSLTTFTDQQKNAFTYYVSGDKQAQGASLLKATLLSSATQLPTEVRVGMSKSQFASAFRQRVIPAVVVVTETEGYQVFMFTFANDRLISIRFDSAYTG